MHVPRRRKGSEKTACRARASGGGMPPSPLARHSAPRNACRVAHGGGCKCLFGIAARLLRRIGGKRPGALCVQIGDVRLLLIFDPDLRRCDTRGFPIFRQHQRDRLSREVDPVVVQRAIG